MNNYGTPIINEQKNNNNASNIFSINQNPITN